MNGRKESLACLVYSLVEPWPCCKGFKPIAVVCEAMKQLQFKLFSFSKCGWSRDQ